MKRIDPTLPAIHDGAISCYGGWYGSELWHRCYWVLISGEWCFHSPLVIDDRLERHGKELLSITTIDASERTPAVEVALCRSRGGTHRLQSVVHMEWSVDGGLEPGEVDCWPGEMQQYPSAESRPY